MSHQKHQFFPIVLHWMQSSPIAAKFATIDLALALPTLRVVLGSLFGGGGGWTIDRPWNFRGKVDAYWRDWEFAAVDGEPGFGGSFPAGESDTVTTVRETRSPDFRIRLTTFSWLAWRTSSPLIWKNLHFVWFVVGKAALMWSKGRNVRWCFTKIINRYDGEIVWSSEWRVGKKLSQQLTSKS